MLTNYWLTKGVVNLSGNGVVKINDHNGNLLHKYDPKMTLVHIKLNTINYLSL